MATIDAPLPGTRAQGEASLELAKSWRKLTRAATVVAVLTAPALFVWFTHQNDWDWWVALLATLTIVIVFRGFADLLFRRLIPWPSLFGLESQTLREEDVVGRRRAWFWRFWFKVTILFITVVTIVWIFRGGTWLDTVGFIFDGIGTVLSSPTLWIQAVFVFFLFFANFAILFGPLLLMNMSQMQSFEPGDAEWGVKLDDVRGQVEAKEEVRRVVDIWQSGEQFERAGGKRERGLLLFGAPGTGKTMLAKAIATGFNSPFISMPGSGFAATFIGIDAIIVRLLARRAKKLARKWGGQCIVFIDEIDAVGMRRQSLGTGAQGFIPLTNGANVEDFLFYGPWGSRDPSGDLIVETRAWRDRLFEQRAPVSYGVPSGMYARLGQFYNFMFPGAMGGMGGGLALNQLLVVMDGIDNPPWMRRTFTSKLNTMLDASFIIPRRIGSARLRLPAARPRNDQIYFIGATNVPIDRLQAFKPLRAVYGNIDGPEIRSHAGEDLHWNCLGIQVFMTHMGGYPGHYSPHAKREIAAAKPALFITGHSHILRVMRDQAADLLHMNPGACGHQGFHSVRTVLRFTVEDAKISQVEAIELGKRGVH